MNSIPQSYLTQPTILIIVKAPGLANNEEPATASPAAKWQTTCGPGGPRTMIGIGCQVSIGASTSEGAGLIKYRAEMQLLPPHSRQHHDRPGPALSQSLAAAESMYRVFLGAPTKDDIHNDPASYHWQTVSSNEASRVKRTITATQSAVFPPATLEAASRQISLIYKNIIFDEQEYTAGDDFVREYQTTLYSWPPSAEESKRADITAPSFLLDISKSGAAATLSQFKSWQETQESQSYDYSDASSIARFPSFHFALSALTALPVLSRLNSGARKVTVLLAVLEIEGPDTIQIKKGADAGKEVSLLKMILGDEEGNVCKLTAWRDVAEMWGGEGGATALKRGDIVFIENVMASCDPKTAPTLSASPYLKSKAEICYRTMPWTREDERLRPDLRLAESDASVRKVADLVRWFEGMAGLAGAAA